MLRWYGRREGPRRPRLIGCLIWLIAIVVILIVMSLLCSGAITLLFRTRDRLLVWQKGVVKW